MSLIDTARLALITGPLTAEEDAAAEQCITDAQAEIESFLAISPLPDDTGQKVETFALSPGARYVALAAGPAASVTAVSLDGNDITESVVNYGTYLDLGQIIGSGRVGSAEYYGGVALDSAAQAIIGTILTDLAASRFARFRDRLAGIEQYAVESERIIPEPVRLTDAQKLIIAKWRRDTGGPKTW